MKEKTNFKLPQELVHLFKLTVFHCLLRETLLCLTESIQSTQMMESLSVTGFKRFSLGWTESDLYGLGYAYSSLTAHAGSFIICCSAGSLTQYGSST